MASGATPPLGTCAVAGYSATSSADSLVFSMVLGTPSDNTFCGTRDGRRLGYGSSLKPEVSFVGSDFVPGVGLEPLRGAILEFRVTERMGLSNLDR